MPRGQDKENQVPASVNPPLSALELARRQILGKRKERDDTAENSGDEDGNKQETSPENRIGRSDQLVGYGRHFGRTVHTFCDFHTLIREGQNRVNELTLRGIGPEHMSLSERRDQEIFNQLIHIVPGLEDRLWDECSTSDDKKHIADLLRKGAKGARSDDMKGVKGALVDWVTPPNGVLRPPLVRNTKNGRGFHHEETGKYLCPTDYDWTDVNIKRKLRTGELLPNGDQWPLFLFSRLKYNQDDPWEGFMRGMLLIQGFKFVFTSPSSVDGEARATRSGNAAIHGMKRVTAASLVYIATLVRHALSSSAALTTNDSVMQNEGFFQSLLSFLEDPQEKDELDDLLKWWDGLIFPGQTPVGRRRVPETSALANLQKRRRRILQTKSQATGNGSSS